MKKFYENPFMTVKRFDIENIETASGVAVDVVDIDKLESDYSVKTIDVKDFDFTF